MNAYELFGTLVERLGWTLLHSLWVGAVVAALLALALAALRRRSPQARYLATSAAMAAMLVLGVATFILVRPAEVSQPPQARAVETPPETAAAPASKLVQDPLSLPSPADPVLPDATATASAPPASATTEQALLPPLAAPSWPERFRQAAEPYLPWLVAAWFAGLLGLSVWRVGGWIAAMRLRVIGVQPIGPEIEAVARRLAERLGLRRPIRVVQSLVVQTPMVIGWLRPVILLPLSALTGLTATQLEAILAHELAHIRRHDYLINLLQTVVETLLFYHPAVWWISGRMRAERERCCDDVAVQLSGDAIAYAEALAAVEETRPLALAVVAAGSPAGHDLVDRIRRVLGLPDRPHYAGALSALAALAVVGIIALSMAFHVSAQIWAKDAWDSNPFADTVAIEILHQRKGGQPATYRIDEPEAVKKLLAALKITGIRNGIAESNIPPAFATFRKKDGSSLRVSIDSAEQLAGRQGHIYITSDFVKALNRQLTANAGHEVNVLEFLPDTTPPVALVPDASLRSLTAGFQSLDVNYVVGKRMHQTRIVDRKTLDEMHAAMGTVKQGPRHTPQPRTQSIRIASKDGSFFYALPLSETELSEPRAGRFTVESGFVRAVEAYLTRIEGRPIRLLEDNQLLPVQVQREKKLRELLADVQGITLFGPLLQCSRPLVIEKPAKAAELVKLLDTVQIPLQERKTAKEGSFVELTGRDGRKTRITWLKTSDTPPDDAALSAGDLVEVAGFGQAWIDNQWRYRLRDYVARLGQEADDDRQLAITRAVAADLPKFLKTAVSITVHYRESGQGMSVTLLRDSLAPVLAALEVEKVEPLDWDKARWASEAKPLMEREAGFLQIAPGTGYSLPLIVTGEREMLLVGYGRVIFKTSPLAALKKALADGDVKPEAIELLPRAEKRGAAAEKPAKAEGKDYVFGPVVERTFNPTDRQHDRFLDLDTGKLFDLPDSKEVKSLPEGGKLADIKAWAAGKGIDLFAEDVPVGLELAVFPRPDNRGWDEPLAKDLLSILQQAEGGTPAPLMPGKELPATYYFKTREGAMGALQIVEFIEKKEPGQPRGVKIRYKLLKGKLREPRDKFERSKTPDASTPIIHTWVGAEGRKSVVYQNGNLVFFDGLGPDAHRLAEVDAKEQHVVVSSQGRYTALCSQFVGVAGPARIFDQSGKKVGEFQLENPWKVQAISDSGPVVALGKQLPGPSPSVVRLCDHTGNLLADYSEDGARVAFSRAGIPVVWGAKKAGGKQFVSVLNDRCQPTATYESPNQELYIHEAATSSDASLVALIEGPRSDSFADRVTLWRPGKAADATVSIHLPKDLGVFQGGLSPLSFTPSGDSLVLRLGATGIGLIDTRSGKLVVVQDLKKLIAVPFTNILSAVSMHDGTILALLYREEQQRRAVHHYCLLDRSGRPGKVVPLEGFERMNSSGSISIQALGRQKYAIVGQYGHVVLISTVEDEKIPAIEKAPAKMPRARAALSREQGGAVVELLALQAPGKDGPWWTPDGRPLDRPMLTYGLDPHSTIAQIPLSGERYQRRPLAGVHCRR